MLLPGKCTNSETFVISRYAKGVNTAVNLKNVPAEICRGKPECTYSGVRLPEVNSQGSVCRVAA